MLKPVTKNCEHLASDAVLVCIIMINVYLPDIYVTDDETVVFMVLDGFGTWFRIQVVRVFSYSLVLQISRACFAALASAASYVTSDFTPGCISVVVILS